MAISNFLSGDFRYLQTLSVTDVDTIISDLLSELVTNGSWTDEASNIFRSPVNAGNGSYMQIELTRVSATQLQWICKDHQGNVINNQTSNKQNIDATGSTVEYFTGPDYVCVQVHRATFEVFFLARLNQWPHEEGEIFPIFVASRGPRNDAGTLTYNQAHYWFSFDLNGSSYAYDYQLCSQRSSGAVNRISLSGKYVAWPAELLDDDSNTWLGRLPQTMLIDYSRFDAGDELELPIDDGTTGTFIVLGFAKTTNTYLNLCIRKA